MVSHPGRSSAQGHCLSLFCSLFCACTFNKYWLRRHLKCLMNVSGIACCFWAPAITDTHLSHPLLFKWNWLWVVKKKKRSSVHLTGSPIGYWTCLYFLKDRAIVFEGIHAHDACIILIITHTSPYIHTAHGFMHWSRFVMFRSILQSDFSDLKILCSAYLQDWSYSAHRSFVLTNLPAIPLTLCCRVSRVMVSVINLFI